MGNPLLLSILWVFIYSYMILASVDFGASFYLFYGKNIQKEEASYAMIDDFLSPLSEIINICFVFLFAALTGLSPEMTFYYRTPLAFSGVLAVLLSIIKGMFFAVGQLTGKSSVKRICQAGSGVTGVFIPVAMSIAMVVSEGGFADAESGGLAVFLSQLATSFYFWTVLIIALVSVLYIGAMFLVLLASSCGNAALSDRMRHIALFWSMPTVIASGLVFLGLQRQNPDHFMAALDLSWLFLLSLGCLLFAVSLIFLKRMYFLSFLLVMLQYFFALWGYVYSHLPYIIFPDIRVTSEAYRVLSSDWVLPLILAVSLAVPAVYLLVKTVMVRRMIAFRRG